MPERKALKDILVGPQFIDGAVAYAFEKNSELRKLDPKKVYGFARKIAGEMAFFEGIGRKNSLRVPETLGETRRVKAIWDASGVGTYLKEFQEDRWKNLAWAGWTDRRRLNFSGALMRRYTETTTGEFPRARLGESVTPEQIKALRAEIKKSGPYLIYGSTLEQNDDVRKALRSRKKGMIIPRSKVHIIDFPEKPVGVNTIDQMKNFNLPEGLEVKDGDILAIVAHAPHMVRILHMLNYFRPLPEGLLVQPRPLPSPPAAGTEYAKMEISGILYYALIRGYAVEDTYPFQI